MSHEAQVIVTATLLAVTAILALFCDFLRMRFLRKALEPESEKTVLQPTISDPRISSDPRLPAMPFPAPVSPRRTRPAASLQEPRRDLPAGTVAAIKRGSRLANPLPKAAAAAHGAGRLQRIG